MQALTITNGDTKLVLIPDDDFERVFLNRLLSAECTVETIADSTRILDRAVNNAIVIHSKIDKNGK